ncbi:hypothetical protein HZF24_00020 [Sedimentibacter hydroxybenzoicus DSM 7310]|uniref:Large polyvalent protein-associated domain-containing protein n=1 Tax=Sedimentibacter hydroxybenzoicus DSM 7310 TaxID=1123245 RepID=A0A974GUS4_SEDHY|nr:hypothetical protein [Sedimentibacter hydroxybenzoicus]NYB72519.1 hypothetical protein [Sedimentibacter hydroxybenzoicus DSM 7310]
MAVRKTLEEIEKEREGMRLTTVSPNSVRRKTLEEIERERGFEPIPEPPGMQPLTNIKNNFTHGKLQEDENKAWNEYRSKQTPESLLKAQQASKQRENFASNNMVGYGNVITKDFAQYVPQLINQTGAGLKGAAPGALVGANTFGYTAAIMGQMGPQIAIPEEIITVPTAAAMGAYQGGKVGYVKGVAEYSYNAMAGAAYKNLLDLGVPNDIALKASGDEAFISSLIEASGAAVDVATLGASKLFSKVLSNPAKDNAQKAAQSYVKSALKAYGANLVSETLEEAAQEKVSIETEKKAMSQAGLTRTATSQEDWDRIKEAGKGGFNIALVSGGINAGGNIAVNKLNDRQSKLIDREYNRIMDELPEDSPIRERIYTIKENGAAITDDVKTWAIRSAGEEFNFESEVDNIMRQNRQTVQAEQNENNILEQSVENGQTFVKTQNVASETKRQISNVFGIENVQNPTEVKSKVNNYYQDLISTSEVSKPILNKNTNLPIEVSRATINQTFGADERFRKAADNEIKIAAMENIVPLIENGEMQIIDSEGKPSSKVPYANIAGAVEVNGIPYTVNLEVRRTDNGNKMFVHSIKTEDVANKKSGMINNGHERNIDPVAYRIMDRIGQATGIKIAVVPNIASPDGTNQDFANGQYDAKTNTLEISTLSSNPVMVVAKHEITHMLQQKSPKLYKEYKDYIINSMKEAGTYDGVYDEYELRHRTAGLDLSESQIQDEIVADATETFLTDRSAIEKLVNKNRTLGQKILDAIREFIGKVDEAVRGVTSGWMGVEQLRTAERMWVEALNSVAEKQKEALGERLQLPVSEKAHTGIDPVYNNGISKDNENENKNPTKENADIRYSLKENVSAEQIAETAEKHYGVKGYADWDKIGSYITVNGNTLKSNIDINKMFNIPDDMPYNSGEIEFLNMGNIKLTRNGINVAVKPRNNQINELTQHLKQIKGNGKIVVDYISPLGYTIGGTVYNKGTDHARIINEINSYFETGVIPELKESDKVYYQLKDDKDINRLIEINKRLKEQFKLTKGVKLDKKTVKKLSRGILKDYNSNYSHAEMENRLYNLYDKIANDTIDFEEMQAEMQSIARDILDSTSVLNDTMHKEYAELRKTLRNTAITLPDKYHGDFKQYGSFDAFRKKNFGRMNLTADGMVVDVLYQELSEMYPELFLKDIANPSDQLMLISDVLDGLMPVYENPFDRDMNTAVEYLAAELFGGMTDVAEAKPTFADKKKTEKKAATDKLKLENKERISRILEQQAEKREKAVNSVKKRYEGEAYKTWWRNKLKENDIRSHYQQMIKELRAEKNQKIDETASRYRERVGRIYEDRKMRETKANIARKVKRLDTLLRKPTEKKHVPKVLEKSIAELLLQIDFSTDIDKFNKRVYGSMEKGPMEKEKWDRAERSVEIERDKALRLLELRAEYENITKTSAENGIETAADPYIMEALKELNGKPVTDMNLNELEMLRNVVAYFEKLVRDYNKVFVNGKQQNISDISNKILKELRTDKTANESANFLVQAGKDMFNWDMMTPLMFARRMGKTFESVYKDMSRANDRKLKYTQITYEYMADLLKDVSNKGVKQTVKDLTAGKGMAESFGGEIAKWSGDNAKVTKFQLESKEAISLTPAQVMSLYLLNKREQAQGHIYGFGIKAAPIVAKYVEKGENGKHTFKKHITKQFEPVKVTPADVQKMTATLTKEQKKVADGISKFLNTYSKQWVNEATLQNYGYELAKEENYFPIRSNDDFLKTELDFNALEKSLKSMGMLKQTVKGANNSIIIDDIFDTFTDHADKSATYGSLLTAIENMKKIVNFRTSDVSVKLAMEKKFGRVAFAYLRQFLNDMQGGLTIESNNAITSFLTRKAKMAMIGMNARVIIQQPTAYIRAAAVMDLEYLIKGAAMKSDMEEMLKHSSVAWWKSQGFFDINTGRAMKDVLLGKRSILDKQYAGMQKADDLTWAKIWNAVKLEIKDTMPDLKVGSEEYFEAVAERFSDVIEETQVVDTVLHRSGMMRRKDWSYKMVTNFMSEPTKNYNLLLDAFYSLKDEDTSAGRKKFARVMSAYVATTLVNTFVQSMMDLWRQKDDDDETLWQLWRSNLIGEPLGMLPIVSDIYSMFQGFTVKRFEYEGLYRIVRSTQRFYENIVSIAEGKKLKYSWKFLVRDLIEATGYLTGLSAKNVNRELEAILRRCMEWSGDDKGLIDDVYSFMFEK